MLSRSHCTVERPRPLCILRAISCWIKKSDVVSAPAPDAAPILSFTSLHFASFIRLPWKLISCTCPAAFFPQLCLAHTQWEYRTSGHPVYLPISRKKPTPENPKTQKNQLSKCPLPHVLTANVKAAWLYSIIYGGRDSAAGRVVTKKH